MIPLHLHTNTIHVTEEQADLLVRDAVADWLPGVRALVSRRSSDDEILAAIS